MKIACYFIFLNKTCFRGLHRIGPNGFNVSFGNYKNPSFTCEENISKLHKLFQNVEFINKDFKDSMKNIKYNDFVYLDPPYYPENKLSFTKYNLNDFTDES